MNMLSFVLACVLAADPSYHWQPYPDGDTTQVALVCDGKQIGAYRFRDGLYRPYNAACDTWDAATTPPIKPPTLPKEDSTDALDEVNAARAARGLRPFTRDDGLTQAAKACAAYRAKRLIAGHSPDDFRFVPNGSRASAAGAGAGADSFGWLTCCSWEPWTYAGAAWSRGADGRRFMSLFVR